MGSTLTIRAERFSRVASEITDDEIKQIIKSELRNQVSKVNFRDILGEVVDDWFEQDDTGEFIWNTLQESIKNRLKF